MNPFSRTMIWRWLRERMILKRHRRVAAECEKLIAEYQEHPVHFTFSQKKVFDTDKIIWQYWAQGYDNVPEIVRDCLASVDRYAGNYTIIRLTDSNLSAYLDLPDFLLSKRPLMTKAHFSDLLRLMLLKTYGGIWMDATILLTGPIPEAYSESDFFCFRRDPMEPDYRYWRNVYAYYFGWAKGFRVNMMNSFIVAKKENRTISELCDLMLLWWKHNEGLPDYFFFQILFDVYGAKEGILVSDTIPHYLQQSINDSRFNLMDRAIIRETITIHKLSYK